MRFALEVREACGFKHVACAARVVARVEGRENDADDAQHEEHRGKCGPRGHGRECVALHAATGLRPHAREHEHQEENERDRGDDHPPVREGEHRNHVAILANQESSVGTQTEGVVHRREGREAEVGEEHRQERCREGEDEHHEHLEAVTEVPLIDGGNEHNGHGAHEPNDGCCRGVEECELSRIEVFAHERPLLREGANAIATRDERKCEKHANCEERKDARGVHAHVHLVLHAVAVGLVARAHGKRPREEGGDGGHEEARNRRLHPDRHCAFVRLALRDESTREERTAEHGRKNEERHEPLTRIQGEGRVFPASQVPLHGGVARVRAKERHRHCLERRAEDIEEFWGVRLYLATGHSRGAPLRVRNNARRVQHHRAEERKPHDDRGNDKPRRVRGESCAERRQRVADERCGLAKLFAGMRTLLAGLTLLVLRGLLELPVGRETLRSLLTLRGLRSARLALREALRELRRLVLGRLARGLVGVRRRRGRRCRRRKIRVGACTGPLRRSLLRSVRHVMSLLVGAHTRSPCVCNVHHRTGLSTLRAAPCAARAGHGRSRAASVRIRARARQS